MDLSKSDETVKPITTLTHSQEKNNDQKIKTTLRQRSLLFWLEANKRKSNTTARLHDNSTVIKGKFKAVDANETKFRFENWESPVGIYDQVVIRGSDIEVLELEFTE
ncbi:19634_t:CDS:2 [Funneliformis geosporum]|nr:19634_t:CDS:2 [Funneliformis geosporum]